MKVCYMNPPLSRKILQIEYRNPHYSIERTKVDFGEYAKEYFVIKHGPRSGLLIHRDDSILLVQQYRQLINGLSWEISGGKIDEGEKPEEAAIREGLEETGLRCRELSPLIYYQPGMDTFDNPTHVFSSSHFEAVPNAEIDEREVIQIAWFSLSQCLEMIRRGEIQDVMSVMAIAAHQLSLLGIRLHEKQ
ncbi:MAG: NUDIX hydrolase [Candidatus Omnitrophota bacterium]